MSDTMTPLAVVNADLRQKFESTVNGKSMKALSLKRKAKQHELAVTKIVQPATIINFNPVALFLDSGLPFKSVPKSLDPHVPEDMRVVIKHDGREFIGSYITLRPNEAYVYPKIDDVKEVAGEAAATYNVGVVMPIENVHHIWGMYNGMSPSSSNMGGIIIFQGDRHTISAAKLKQSENIVNVPVYETLEDHTRAYYTEERKFGDVVAETFKKQKDYALQQIALAQAHYDGAEDERKNITPVHRIWAEYAVRMGWKAKAPDWVYAEDEARESCKSCGTARKGVESRMCVCGSFFDPLGSFLEGHNVPESQLYIYKEPADVTKIKAENARRKALFA